MNSIEEAALRLTPTITAAEVNAEMARMRAVLAVDQLPYGFTFDSVRNTLAAARAVEEQKQRTAALKAKVADEPEIKALRAKLDDATRRRDQVKAQGHVVVARVAEVIGSLGADIARLEAETEALAVKEALAGELAFDGAVAKLAAIEPLRRRLAAANIARAKLGANDGRMLERMSSEVSAAASAVNDALQRRWREVDAPEAVATA
jgi:hypothetical protein